MMGYFPNGTAGLGFEERWCSRCVHMPEAQEDGCCPVWSAHLKFSYELCNEKAHPGKVILDMLIPDGEQTCAMFHARPGEDNPDQLKLFEAKT